MLVHGSNLEQKEKHRTKYRDALSKTYLAEIRSEYDKWHQANNALTGSSSKLQKSDKAIVKQRVALLETYKNFIDQQKYAENFDSRSNLHSSVLEEFLYYLFYDLVTDFGHNALIGKSHAFKDLFFMPPNYKAMTKQAYGRIERKDHDFVIGTAIEAHLTIKPHQSSSDLSPTPTDNHTVEKHLFDIPAVVVECKTYLDKTMLEGASRAAEELKAKNPNGLYIVVMEWLKLTQAVNLRKYKVDQIYVLRKQKNTDREFRYSSTYTKNPIDSNVVWHLFKTVHTHLTTDWESSIQYGLEQGRLIL